MISRENARVDNTDLQIDVVHTSLVIRLLSLANEVVLLNGQLGQLFLEVHHLGLNLVNFSRNLLVPSFGILLAHLISPFKASNEASDARVNQMLAPGLIANPTAAILLVELHDKPIQIGGQVLNTVTPKYSLCLGHSEDREALFAVLRQHHCDAESQLTLEGHGGVWGLHSEILPKPSSCSLVRRILFPPKAKAPNGACY
jgi:hypothetical protein